MLRYDPPGRTLDDCADGISDGIRLIHGRLFAELGPALPNLSRNAAAGFNCRWINGARGPVPGVPSVHGTGRAFDAMANAGVPTEKAAGDAFVAWLVEHADTLGTQLIMYNRRIWGRNIWSWRALGPRSYDHRSHVHFEINTGPTVLPKDRIVDTVPDYPPDVLTSFAPVPGAQRNARGLLPGWWTDTDGTVTTVEGAWHYGDLNEYDILPDEPIVALVPTATGAGYWLVAADLGLFAFGDASYPPDHKWAMDAIRAAGGLNAPIIGAALTSTGILVSYAADFGVFPLPT